MNIDEATIKLENLESDIYLQNLIAQANARYILLNTDENRENFPNYSLKDDNLGLLAFQYLNIGCSFAENNDFDTAKEPLEKGAAILEYIHGAKMNRTDLSNYYGLVSALSYYVAFQYSKSFILIKKFDDSTVISKILFLFLKRDFKGLNEEINSIVVDDTYTDEYLAENVDEEEGDSKIYEFIIAKSLNNFLLYFYTGNNEYLVEARKSLLVIKEISELRSDPGIWWIIRFLLLILEGFNESSIWKVLYNYFDLTNDVVRKYILSLVYLTKGEYELFITQRKALPVVLSNDNNGSVVSIPTSSGKTRIAEIAILNTLIKYPLSKVLYIAPFRSLAYEIENSLEKIFDNCNFTVSQLYGGKLFSKLDEKIIEDSHIIIATPEKAKAMLRANADILNSIKLVVMDEGHLLGPEKRHIVNEIFFEELRYFVNNNNGKFLLLSAVLPNVEQISQWLSESEDNFYKATWRPSDERLGTLEWTGVNVNLLWKSTDEERESYNRKFITKVEIPLQGKQRVIRFFPGDKNEAITATAYSLKVFGTVLIYVPIKPSVFVMARAYIKSLGENPPDFVWRNQNDWKAFELACLEFYGNDCEWIKFARKGILCHNADLYSDVRLPLERLMRNGKPLVIIATSTLGQGVNLGISTVIFSRLDRDQDVINSRDFWNIAGRAGRAFVDHEGKILIALDVSSATSLSKRRGDRIEIERCFNKDNISKVESGIFILLKVLKQISQNVGLSFERLLELISENQCHELGKNAEDIEEYLDWIDDSLLSLLEINNQTEDEIDYGWIENVFRKSLAYIQAEQSNVLTGEQVLSLIKSRIIGIINRVGDNRDVWKSIVTSGIPLSISLLLEDKLTEIIESIEGYLVLENNIDNKINLLTRIETIVENIPTIKKGRNGVSDDQLDKIRNTWIKGNSILDLENNVRAIKVINDYFIFTVPWIINAIAKKLRLKSLDVHSDRLEELAMLIEIGLPTVRALKIFQAGIRSRISASEIDLVIDDVWWEQSIKDFKTELIHNKEIYKGLVSQSTKEWIDLLSNSYSNKRTSINPTTSFRIGDFTKPSELLFAKKINGKQYLVSSDLNYLIDVSASKLELESINNIAGIYYKFNNVSKLYELVIENPYVKL